MLHISSFIWHESNFLPKKFQLNGVVVLLMSHITCWEAYIGAARCCSFETTQSLWKAIPQVCEKLQKSPQKKQAVIKTLAEKSGIIHSQKQPSNNVTSNETVSFTKNFFTCPDIVYTMAGIKNEITIHQNSTKNLRESTTSPRFYKEAYKNYTELPHQYLIRSNVNQCKFLIHENLIKMILCLHFNMLLKWHHIIFHILFLETCKSYGLCQTGLSIEKKRKIFWKHCALAYVKECSALKKSFGMSYINWKRIMTT